MNYNEMLQDPVGRTILSLKLHNQYMEEEDHQKRTELLNIIHRLSELSEEKPAPTRAIEAIKQLYRRVLKIYAKGLYICKSIYIVGDEEK